jgi:hypothetical protein
MQHLQGRYSRRFNRRWSRTGPLWQSRYQARLITDQDYFETVLMYVHLNPVKAGLVDDPVDYAFSGHREIMGKVKNPLVDVDVALVSFGDTVKKARRYYSDRVKAGLDDDTEDRLLRSLRPLPSWDRDLKADEPVFTDELGRSSGLERPHLEAAHLLPNTDYFRELTPDDRAARALWSGHLLDAAAGCGLVFLDPDIGIEVRSTPAGRKGSSKYAYSRELSALFAHGASLLVYQHFARVPRELYTESKTRQLGSTLGVHRVFTFTTSHVLFLLAPQPGHEQLLAAAAELAAQRWRGQVRFRAWVTPAGTPS